MSLRHFEKDFLNEKLSIKSPSSSLLNSQSSSSQIHCRRIQNQKACISPKQMTNSTIEACSEKQNHHSSFGPQAHSLWNPNNLFKKALSPVSYSIHKRQSFKENGQETEDNPKKTSKPNLSGHPQPQTRLNPLFLNTGSIVTESNTTKAEKLKSVKDPHGFGESRERDRGIRPTKSQTKPKETSENQETFGESQRGLQWKQNQIQGSSSRETLKNEKGKGTWCVSPQKREAEKKKMKTLKILNDPPFFQYYQDPKKASSHQNHIAIDKKLKAKEKKRSSIKLNHQSKQDISIPSKSVKSQRKLSPQKDLTLKNESHRSTKNLLREPHFEMKSSPSSPFFTQIPKSGDNDSKQSSSANPETPSKEPKMQWQGTQDKERKKRPRFYNKIPNGANESNEENKKRHALLWADAHGPQNDQASSQNSRSFHGENEGKDTSKPEAHQLTFSNPFGQTTSKKMLLGQKLGFPNHQSETGLKVVKEEAKKTKKNSNPKAKKNTRTKSAKFPHGAFGESLIQNQASQKAPWGYDQRKQKLQNKAKEPRECSPVFEVLSDEERRKKNGTEFLNQLSEGKRKKILQKHRTASMKNLHLIIPESSNADFPRHRINQTTPDSRFGSETERISSRLIPNKEKIERGKSPEKRAEIIKFMKKKQKELIAEKLSRLMQESSAKEQRKKKFKELKKNSVAALQKSVSSRNHHRRVASTLLPTSCEGRESEGISNQFYSKFDQIYDEFKGSLSKRENIENKRKDRTQESERKRESLGNKKQSENGQRNEEKSHEGNAKRQLGGLMLMGETKRKEFGTNYSEKIQEIVNRFDKITWQLAKSQSPQNAETSQKHLVYLKHSKEKQQEESLLCRALKSPSRKPKGPTGHLKKEEKNKKASFFDTDSNKKTNSRNKMTQERPGNSEFGREANKPEKKPLKQSEPISRGTKHSKESNRVEWNEKSDRLFDEEDLLNVLNEAATQIQRVWRGHYSRKIIKEFLISFYSLHSREMNSANIGAVSPASGPIWLENTEKTGQTIENFEQCNSDIDDDGSGASAPPQNSPASSRVSIEKEGKKENDNEFLSELPLANSVAVCPDAFSILNKQEGEKKERKADQFEESKGKGAKRQRENGHYGNTSEPKEETPKEKIEKIDKAFEIAKGTTSKEVTNQSQFVFESPRPFEREKLSAFSPGGPGNEKMFLQQQIIRWQNIVSMIEQDQMNQCKERNTQSGENSDPKFLLSLVKSELQKSVSELSSLIRPRTERGSAEKEEIDSLVMTNPLLSSKIKGEEENIEGNEEKDKKEKAMSYAQVLIEEREKNQAKLKSKQKKESHEADLLRDSQKPISNPISERPSIERSENEELSITSNIIQSNPNGSIQNNQEIDFNFPDSKKTKGLQNEENSPEILKRSLKKREGSSPCSPKSFVRRGNDEKWVSKSSTNIIPNCLVSQINPKFTRTNISMGTTPRQANLLSHGEPNNSNGIASAGSNGNLRTSSIEKEALNSLFVGLNRSVDDSPLLLPGVDRLSLSFGGKNKFHPFTTMSPRVLNISSEEIKSPLTQRTPKLRRQMEFPNGFYEESSKKIESHRSKNDSEMPHPSSEVACGSQNTIVIVDEKEKNPLGGSKSQQSVKVPFDHSREKEELEGQSQAKEHILDNEEAITSSKGLGIESPKAIQAGNFASDSNNTGHEKFEEEFSTCLIQDLIEEAVFEMALLALERNESQQERNFISPPLESLQENSLCISQSEEEKQAKNNRKPAKAKKQSKLDQDVPNFRGTFPQASTIQPKEAMVFEETEVFSPSEQMEIELDLVHSILYHILPFMLSHRKEILLHFSEIVNAGLTASTVTFFDVGAPILPEDILISEFSRLIPLFCNHAAAKDDPEIIQVIFESILEEFSESVLKTVNLKLGNLKQIKKEIFNESLVRKFLYEAYLKVKGFIEIKAGLLESRIGFFTERGSLDLQQKMTLEQIREDSMIKMVTDEVVSPSSTSLE